MQRLILTRSTARGSHLLVSAQRLYGRSPARTRSIADHTKPSSQPPTGRAPDGSTNRTRLGALVFLVLAVYGSFKVGQLVRKPFISATRRVREWRAKASSPEYRLLASDEIRLLILEPGAPDSPIQCRLVENVSLDHTGDFEALSYVWGDASDTRQITCGDKTVTITRSLYDALHGLRHADKRRVLWADAICINQHDDVEKGMQVSLMGHIYGEAARVLIWLGEPTERSRSALATLRTADTYLADHLKYYRIWREAAITGTSSHALPPVLLLDKMRLSRQQSVEISALDWTAFNELLVHPWFRRLWVYQEFAKASQPVLVLGSEQISLKTFLRCLTVLYLQDEDITRSTNLNENAASGVLGLVETMLREAKTANKETAPPRRLLDLVAEGFWRLGTDDRDRIYAFRGVADDVEEGDWELAPDYTVPVEEVYKRFTRWYLLRKGNLEVLRYCTADIESECALPSWVRDWKAFAPRPFVHDSNSSPVAEAVVLWQPDQPDTIQVKGTLVDRVQHLAVSPFQIRSLETAEDEAGAQFGSRRFMSMVKRSALSPDSRARLIRQWHNAADARQQFASNHVPAHEMPYVVWMEQCKQVALGGEGHLSKQKLDAFYQTMMIGNVDGRLKQAELLRYIHLLEDVREGKKMTAPRPSEIYARGKGREARQGRDQPPWLRQRRFAAKPILTSMRQAVQERQDNELRDKIDFVLRDAAHYRFCSTGEDRLGWMPMDARSGDIICVFDGSSVPFVLRPRSRNDSSGGLQSWLGLLGWSSSKKTYGVDEYELVGDCYLHGMMNGEASRLQDVRPQYFRLS